VLGCLPIDYILLAMDPSTSKPDPSAAKRH
jgi:hypothetical protein